MAAAGLTWPPPAARPEAVVTLVGAEPGGSEACFLVQAGPAGPEDVSHAGKRLQEALGAKGGGRGRTFQGHGGRWPGDRALLDSA